MAADMKPVFDDVFSEIKSIAEDNISCVPCCNYDWKQFLYISFHIEYAMAACKGCGTVYKYSKGEWVKHGLLLH